ncbi:hypothetical protein D1224_01350 [Henriciella barbarensis]|uniref:Uncharacterized protein n=2 Tax=Henriciella barbarensis TaxID=86342 RepID=A0A399R2S7_9PROT|nr:hypothetical protein D1224_01350 [Henriciella barbarensis]
MVIGGGIAAIILLMIVWFVWKNSRANGQALKLALDGVGHEFRFNLQRVLSELRELNTNGDVREDLAVQLARPQLASLLTQPAIKDRRSLERLDATYQTLEAGRSAVRQGQTDDTIGAYRRRAVEALAILYLWEHNKGGLPEKAPSTSRSAVRNWVKSLGFTKALIPGMALRDEVFKDVRRLRTPLRPSEPGMTAEAYYGTPESGQGEAQGELAASVPEEVESAPSADEPVQMAAEPEIEEAPAENDFPEPEGEQRAAEASVEHEPLVDNAVVEPTPAPITGDLAQPSRRRRRRR